MASAYRISITHSTLQTVKNITRSNTCKLCGKLWYDHSWVIITQHTREVIECSNS